MFGLEDEEVAGGFAFAGEGEGGAVEADGVVHAEDLEPFLLGAGEEAGEVRIGGWNWIAVGGELAGEAGLSGVEGVVVEGSASGFGPCVRAGESVVGRPAAHDM